VLPVEISLNIRLLYFLLFLHCLIGSLGALIAANKGYNRLIWLLLGLLGGTFTLVVTLTLDQKPKKLTLKSFPCSFFDSRSRWQFKLTLEEIQPLTQHCKQPQLLPLLVKLQNNMISSMNGIEQILSPIVDTLEIKC